MRQTGGGDVGEGGVDRDGGGGGRRWCWVGVGGGGGEEELEYQFGERNVLQQKRERESNVKKRRRMNLWAHNI